MKVEVVIPAYNEQAIIKETTRIIARVLEEIPALEWKITVADNGSTDATRMIIEGMADPRITVYTASGKGKGLALREAFLRSDAPIVGFFDADLSVDPKALPQTLQVINDGIADVVIGSRFHPDSHVDRGLYRSGSSRFFNILARTVVRVSHSDTQCGFKFMNAKGKHIFSKNKEDTWFFDLEFLAQAKKEGLSVQERPVDWTESRYEKRKSKLSPIRDGARGILAVFRIRARLGKVG